MSKSIHTRARTIATLGVASALAVGGVAVAQNGSGDGDSKQNKQGEQRRGKRMHHPPGGPIGGPIGKNLTYAEFHVQRNGESEVIRLDRGKITAVSDSSITLSENDGNEVTIAVDGDTKVLAGPGGDQKVTDLKTGQKVVVTGPEGGTAKAVMVPPKRGQMKGGQRGGPQQGGPPQGPPRGAQQGGPPQGAQQNGQLPPPPPGGEYGAPQGGRQMRG